MTCDQPCCTRVGNINEPLLRAAVDYIESNPQEWDQRDWEMRPDLLPFLNEGRDTDWYREVIEKRGEECGTTRCLAGTVLAIHYDHFDKPLMALPELRSFTRIETKAAELLGLTRNQAWDIFQFGANDDDNHRHPTIEEFKTRITEVTGVKFKGEHDASE